jgi:hypothetical protein
VLRHAGTSYALILSGAVDGAFVLNGTTLAAIGAMLGAMVTGMSVLFRALIASKDEQIRTKEEQNQLVSRDRDYWRDLSVSLMNANERAVSIAEDASRRVRRST